MEESLSESKLARKLRLRAESLSQDQKAASERLRAEREERVTQALADALARDTIYYQKQSGLSRIDPDELARTVAEAEADIQSESQLIAEQRLRKIAMKLTRVFRTVSGDRLSLHAAMRMIQRDIRIAAVIERRVTVIDRPGRNGSAVIITTYPKSGADSL